MRRFPDNFIKRVLRALLPLALASLLIAGCSPALPDAVAEAISDEDRSSSPASSPDISANMLRDSVRVPAEPLRNILPDAGNFTVLFVNVGRADAAILRFGETTVLVDTGSADSVPQLIAGLNVLGVSSIDAVFVTHSHEDHLGGLGALTANYPIGMVYSPFYGAADKNGIGKVAKRADQLGLPYRTLFAGDTLQLGSVNFSVLAPIRLNEADDNDNSLVLRVTFAGKTFLFAGDMQFSEEQTLLDSGADLKSDVLKIGNHGNPDATGDGFAALVSPACAVISADTTEDKDSAHPRVFGALPSAEVYITQDFIIGVLMTVDESGILAVSNPADDSSKPPVEIASFDKKAQTVTLVNRSSADADLSGCVLFSLRTGAALRFPAGSAIAAGGSLIVGRGGSYAFPGEDEPLKKKNNAVFLYGTFGGLIDERTGD
jgi:competence protein ComEC